MGDDLSADPLLTCARIFPRFFLPYFGDHNDFFCSQIRIVQTHRNGSPVMNQRGSQIEILPRPLPGTHAGPTGREIVVT
jgi:hypothetical protein